MRRFQRVYDHVARYTLAPRAREMRISATASEACLWAALRRGALGVRFRRQVVLGPYIVDFFAPSAGLVVEVDGDAHSGQVPYDQQRDAILGGMGLRVLRLAAELVERDRDSVLARVREALACK